MIFRAFVAYVLMMYGPRHITCNPNTAFGQWCISNSGNWIYRDKR